ncbi:MAG: fumarylacetoacetate hydrolase family protein [Novosphingobium sp.]|jgi:2-keto-4-pentenoate hydratase/2-oxohepta-3-ene-1,7-dioic acid hydratase in catechol pathway|uniref:fumarylacetoacetate hydrolase family protein n=1 Tax=Novosphingobium sp. TaxID=1874826 RepID=UPI00301B283E
MARLVSFEFAGAWHPGLLIGDQVVDTQALLASRGLDVDASSNRRLIGALGAKIGTLGQVSASELSQMQASGNVHALGSLRLGPPIPDPEKIVCIGLNYHDHAEEVGATPPPAPIFFAKYANSLGGAADDIVPPRDTNEVDYEAELAIVIGTAGRYIDRADALSHVAGAMVFNDVSARDLQLANQLWTGGKAIDTFAPCGPAVVTMDEIDDIQNLRVQTRVDGEVLQNGNTASMIFGVADIIAFLSRIMTLKPGDIIATGTPAGVAKAHTPPRWLRAGHVVEVEIERLGMIRNTVQEAY